MLKAGWGVSATNEMILPRVITRIYDKYIDKKIRQHKGVLITSKPTYSIRFYVAQIKNKIRITHCTFVLFINFLL